MDQRKIYYNYIMLDEEEYNKLPYRKWYLKNRERILTKTRDCEKHKERSRLTYIKSRIQNSCIDTTITMEKLYLRKRGICGICNNKVNRKEVHMDHIIPFSKNGTHTWDNVQLAHKVCNARKGAKLLKGY